MKKLCAIFLFFCGVSTAQASLVNVELVDVNGSIPYHGVYAGEYHANVNGVYSAVVCVDPVTWVHLGQVWQAYEFTYADVQSGAATKVPDVQRYSQAAWLVGKMDIVSPSVRAQIHGAIWNIMSPGSIPMDSLAEWYYDQATDGTHNSFDWGGLGNILTPNPYVSGQEFFMRTVVTAPAPVPAAVWLFGSGLLTLIGVSRRPA